MKSQHSRIRLAVIGHSFDSAPGPVKTFLWRFRCVFLLGIKALASVSVSASLSGGEPVQATHTCICKTCQ